MDETEKSARRFLDLYQRSFMETRYCFTDFLGEAEISALLLLVRSGKIDGSYVTLYGGFEGAERRMARFGSEKDFGWTEEFPITLLQISPVIGKFGEELSHRDYLGSLMGLNIDRDTIGDIRISGKNAWIFAASRMADFIMQNLDEVRHTHVRVTRADSLPPDAGPHFQEIELIVPSERADAVTAKLTNLARSKVVELFRSEKVFINGLCVTDNSRKLSENDTLSIRGWGKAVCGGAVRSTKKGNLVFSIRKFV